MKAKIYKVKAYTNEIIRWKFRKVKDWRIAGMIDYPLVDILIIIMLGVISGLEKCEQIERYAKKKQSLLRQVFGINSKLKQSRKNSGRGVTYARLYCSKPNRKARTTTKRSIN